MTDLSLKRSDTFTRRMRIGSRAGEPWIWSDFTSLRFTIRRTPPEKTIVDDTDDAVLLTVDESYFETIDDEWIRINIPASMTNLDVGNWYWDVQGIVAGSPDVVKTPDSGRIRVTYDFSRSGA